MTRISVALALISVAACGHAATPTTPSTTADTVATGSYAYAGQYATSDGLGIGAIELAGVLPVDHLSASDGSAPKATTTYPVTGHLAELHGTDFPCVGNYDSITRKLVLDCGKYHLNLDITIQVGAEIVKGTAIVSIPAGAFGGTTQNIAGVALAPHPTADPPVLFCGSYTGDSKGTFNLTRTGPNLAGIAYETGMPNDPISLGGTFSFGGTTNFTWYYDGIHVGRALGTYDGVSRINGTWSNQDNEKGNWTASTCK